jgi:hypothetical protein
MTAIPSHAPPASAALASHGLTCSRCGGSGILRMGDQQFRTCLDCLGQGQLPTEVQRELLFSDLRAAVSSVHAR